MTVIGVAFAGQQSGNVRTEFQGVFGSLIVNPNGPFAYVLDNTDTDTELLSAGDTALERFSITFVLGGVTRSVSVEISINGVDEPGQAATLLDEAVVVTDDYVVGRDERIEFTSQQGFDEGYSNGVDADWNFTNFGSISVETNIDYPFIYAVTASTPIGQTFNSGRIRTYSTNSEHIDVVAVTDFGENYGVVSALYDGPFVPGQSLGRTIGWARLLRNSGLVESVSTLDAYGVWALSGRGLVNTGLIYVEGGSAYTSADRTDPLGIIGFRSGGTGSVVNSGTVHVVSNTPFVESVGFRFSMNSTNTYNSVNFDNSGTIVADRAIEVSGNFRSSTYLDNSGLIQGDVQITSGVNQIDSLQGGIIRGELLLGMDPDTLTNAGTIVGNVDLCLGNDLYVVLGSGSVSGEVRGGEGSDRLLGGRVTERFSGGDGDDWIEGCGGADQLSGGA